MKKVIALIEDDDVLSGVMKDELEEHGFTVFHAKDGEEGIKIVREKKPDMVLLDIIMPKKGGEEVFQELKADSSTKDIPIIVLTVSTQEASMKEILDAGAVDYIIKSQYAVENIVKKVINYFDGELISDKI
jgi:DNA-binding response OmpR family regulator